MGISDERESIPREREEKMQWLPFLPILGINRLNDNNVERVKYKF